MTYPTEHGTIYIGDRVQFRATVSSSAGGTQAAATAWESDAPAVATVSSSGLVAAVSAGEATITAEVPAHGRGSTRIRVFPEFHGHWEGDLNVTRISVPPDWRELGEEDCDSLPDCASWIPLAVDLGQDDARVTGSVKSTFTASPNYEWTVQSGSVSIDGTLTLTTDELSFRPPSDAITVRASLMRWESRADTPGVMTGTVVVQYSADRLEGVAMVEGCLEADNVIGQCSGMRRQRGGAGVPSVGHGLLRRHQPRGAVGGGRKRHPRNHATAWLPMARRPVGIDKNGFVSVHSFPWRWANAADVPGS